MNARKHTPPLFKARDLSRALRAVATTQGVMQGAGLEVARVTIETDRIVVSIRRQGDQTDDNSNPWHK